MPLPPMRSLARDRRRIGLVVVLAYLGLRLVDPALPVPAAVAALAFGALAALLSLCAPRLRSYGEAMALAGFGFALLVRWLPGSTLDPTGPNGSPLVAAAFFLGLTALARGARRGLRGLRAPLLHNRRFKARASSHVDIHQLWYGLVPSAALAWNTGASGGAPVAETGLRIGRVRPLPPAPLTPPPLALPGLALSDLTLPPRDRASSARAEDPGVQILEIEPPFHVRLRSDATPPQGVMGEAGISEIFLVELGRQRLVLFAHEFSSLPLGRALLAWLDDQPGRLLDRRLALIERRARREDARRDRRPTAATLAAWDADAAQDGRPAQDSETAPSKTDPDRRAS